MTLISKQTFILHILGLSLITSKVQSSVFIVYPFQVGHTNPSKPTFSMRKWGYDDDLRSRKVFDESNLHLIYPVKEELVIMTPSPMEEYDEMPLEETTEISTEYGEGLEDRNRTIKSLEYDDPQRELDEHTTTDAVLEDHTPVEMLSIEGVTSNAEEETDNVSEFSAYTENIIFTDSTEALTTEVPLQKSTTLGSNLPSTYDTTGPLKVLRKRMFGKYEYVPIMRMNFNKMTSTTKMPTSKLKTRHRNKDAIIELKENKSADNKGKTEHKPLYKRRYFNSWKKVKAEPNSEI